MTLLPRLLSADDGCEGEAAERDLDRKAALLLLAAAFLVRVVSAAQTALVATDGVQYIELAGLIRDGRFHEALSSRNHPLYPTLVAVFRFFCGGLESAAFCVPVIFSSLAALFLFWTMRPVFGRPQAIAATAIYAFLPHFVRCGSDTICEGLIHFMVLVSFWAGARAFREGRVLYALLGGAAAGAAYLTKPEGLAALGAFGLYTVFCIAAGPPKSTRFKAALTGLVFLAGFMAPASPYLVFIRYETGQWGISQKKSISGLTKSLEDKAQEGADLVEPTHRFYRPHQAVAVFLWYLMSNFFFVPGVLVLLGLFVPQRAPPRLMKVEALFLIGAGLWSLMCVMVIVSAGYLSFRHSIPAALLLSGHAGRGAVALSGWAGRILERAPGWARISRGLPGRFAFLGFLLLFAFVAGVPENFRPDRTDKTWVREVGREIASEWGQGLVITTTTPRIAYYARGKYVYLLLKGTPDAVRDQRGSEGVELLVFEDDVLKEWAPALHEALSDPSKARPGFTHLKTWMIGRNSDRPVHAYRVHGR